MPAVPWRGKSPRKKNPGCDLYGQNQSQDPNTWWDNNATWDNSHFQLGMPAGTNQDAHRQSPPAMVGWDGLGNCCTPPASDCCNMSAQPPSALHHPFPAGFPLNTVGRGCQAPQQAAQKEPLQEKQCWKFQHRILSARESLDYENAFPLPHVFCLKANKCRQMSFQLQLHSGHQSTQISPSDAVPNQPKPSLEM